MIQRIENFQKVPHASSQTVSRPYRHRVKFSLVGSSQHLVESWTLRLPAADRVGGFVDDFKTAWFR